MSCLNYNDIIRKVNVSSYALHEPKLITERINDISDFSCDLLSTEYHVLVL